MRVGEIAAGSRPASPRRSLIRAATGPVDPLRPMEHCCLDCASAGNEAHGAKQSAGHGNKKHEWSYHEFLHKETLNGRSVG